MVIVNKRSMVNVKGKGVPFSIIVLIVLPLVLAGAVSHHETIPCDVILENNTLYLRNIDITPPYKGLRAAPGSQGTSANWTVDAPGEYPFFHTWATESVHREASVAGMWNFTLFMERPGNMTFDPLIRADIYTFDGVAEEVLHVGENQVQVDQTGIADYRWSESVPEPAVVQAGEKILVKFVLDASEAHGTEYLDREDELHMVQGNVVDFPENAGEGEVFTLSEISGTPVNETRYLRGVPNETEVNNLTAYSLGTEQSDSRQQSDHMSTGGDFHCWGVRGWVRHENGTETEITPGHGVAVVMRSVSDEGYQNNTWDCPETPLEPTDSIVIRLYQDRMVYPPERFVAEFTTEPLGASRLEPSTWNIYYYTFRGGAIYNGMYWGDPERNTRIEGFRWRAMGGRWNRLYNQAPRAIPQNGTGMTGQGTYWGAMRTELNAGEATGMACYIVHQPTFIRGYIHTDGANGTTPGSRIGQTEQINETGPEEWVEIHYREPVQLEGGHYWIILEVRVPDNSTRGLGRYEGHVDDNAWVSVDNTSWTVLQDLGLIYNHALEALISESEGYGLDARMQIKDIPRAESNILEYKIDTDQPEFQLRISDDGGETYDTVIHEEVSAGVFTRKLGPGEIHDGSVYLQMIDNGYDDSVMHSVDIDYIRVRTVDNVTLYWDYPMGGYASYLEIPLLEAEITLDSISIVDSPGTGVHEIVDGTVDAWFTITGHAAGFNTSHGYLEDVHVNWSVDNLNGANAYADPGEGTHSTFHANGSSGTAYWNASYYHQGVWYNDSVVFHISPPTGPAITNVTASPDPQHAGGYVNISCDVTSPEGVSGVWTNITYPDGSHTNLSLNLGSPDRWFLNGSYHLSGEYHFSIRAVDVTGDWNSSFGHSFTIEPSSIDHIVISPVDPSIAAGDTQTFTAVVLDEFGNEIGDVTASTVWSIESGAGGSWSDNVYTSELVGTWVVTGDYGGLMDTTTLTVLVGTANHIEISPIGSTITAGETESYSAVAYDEFGNEIGDVTGDTAWSIESDAGGSWFDNVYTSELVGTWAVTGDYGGLVNTTTLTVLVGSASFIEVSPTESTITAGETESYSAVAYDEFGNEIGDVTGDTTWSIESDAGGSWSDNIYTSENAGTWTVYGDHTGIIGTANLTVIAPPPPAYIVVSPADSSISAGDTQTFTATAFDEFGGEIGDVTASTVWSIESDAGGSWSDNIYTSENAGTWTVTGDYGGLVNATTLTVLVGSASYIEVYPVGSTITAGETESYTAVAYDELGNEIGDVTGATVWSIEPDAGGSWSDNVYTSVYAGTWVVTGNYVGVMDTTTLTVLAGTASYIDVSPVESTVTAGETESYTAVSFDEFGNEIGDVTGATVWSIESGAGGYWLGRVYTSQFVGTWVITAAYNGWENTATLTVTPGGVDSVHLYPGDDQTLIAGNTMDFNAEAMDIFGNLITNQNTDFLWLNTDDTGRFSITTVGEYHVTASYVNVTSQPVKVTVVHAGAVRMSVSPANSTVQAGSAQEFHVDGYDQFGNKFDITNHTVFTIDSAAKGAWFNNVYSSEMAGTWNVTGFYMTLTDTVTLTVRPPSVDYILVTPNQFNLTAGDTLAYNATAYDEFGNLVGDVTPYTTWDIEDGAGGDWHRNIYTSEFVGNWTVRGIYGSSQHNVSLRVQPGLVDHIIIVPGDWNIDAGASVAYTAIYRDQFGNNISDATRNVSWNIESGAGGEWNGNIYTSRYTGNWTVTASRHPYSATALLHVNSTTLNRTTFQIFKVSGDGQERTAGTRLDEPLVVEVRDEYGTPVGRGWTVSFRITTQGLNGDGVLHGLSQPVLTDENSRAVIWWSLDSARGLNQLTAEAVGSTSELRNTTFTATGTLPEVDITVSLNENRATSGDLVVFRVTVDNRGTEKASYLWVSFKLDDKLIYMSDTSGVDISVEGGEYYLYFTDVDVGIHRFDVVCRVTDGVREKQMILTHMELEYTDALGRGLPGTVSNEVSLEIDASLLEKIYWPLPLIPIILAILLVAWYIIKKVEIQDIFLIHESGTLLAHESPQRESGMDDDLFSSMLTAIQDFIRDSFKEEENYGIKRLDFGEKKILVEKGKYSFIAVVYRGRVVGSIEQKMKSVLKDIEEDYEDQLRNWLGEVDTMGGVEEYLQKID